MGWLLLILALVVIALISYWQLIIAEGVYLGPRVVRWLYDLTAGRYDRTKGFDELDEDYFLGQPLAVAVSARHRPLILDVATGTGRLPLTLLRQSSFEGQVFGLDRSTKMLDIAQQHLASCAGQSGLLLASAVPLPVADEQFEAVTCLEALEFFPNATAALREMARVLRPGGWLLITNRVGWEAQLMPGHTWSRAELISILRQLSLTDISVRPWQVYYDLVWARKRSL
jgi:ubiquinone/menaquinone biosynthesis C-methylase UbiE